MSPYGVTRSHELTVLMDMRHVFTQTSGLFHWKWGNRLPSASEITKEYENKVDLYELQPRVNQVPKVMWPVPELFHHDCCG